MADMPRSIPVLPRAQRLASPLGILCRWGALGWLVLIGSATLHGQSASKEYQLKAAFLYNFTKFIEWDAASFSGPGAPIVIGIFGADPFAGELENAVRDRKVNGREIVVRHVSSVAGARNVQLLFVAGDADARSGELKEALRGANVLTVGETDAFTKAGGIITFVIEGDKVRFDINAAAAAQASIRISAQLQKLARSVRR